VTTPVRLADVDFAYPSRAGEAVPPIFQRFSLELPAACITAVVGPSGCGKSTLLNLVAGVLRPSHGTVDRTARSEVAYVPQAPTLVPWRSVRWNALFGAYAVRRRDPADEQRCDQLLDTFLLKDVAAHYPSTLSGGMQQRLSIVRALVSAAPVLLLDEPFSNSDYFMRQRLQAELGRVVEAASLVTLLVTHDLEDCLRTADRILFLSDRPARILGEVAIDVSRSERFTDHGLGRLDSARKAAWKIMGAYHLDAQG
jgi:NitT/TauT family transport system ATP-binding protein